MAPEAGCCGAPSRPGPGGGSQSAPPAARLRFAGSLASTVALALLPKCPMCLVAYLSALGVGAGATSIAGAVYPIAGFAAVAIAGVLGVQLARRARRAQRLAPALAVAAALAAVAIAWLAGAPVALRFAALAGLALALVWANRDAAALHGATRPAHSPAA